MKCAICGNKVETTFLEKPLGTYVRDSDGKRHLVCSACQEKFRTRKEQVEQIEN